MILIDADTLVKRFKQLKGQDTLANMFITDVIKEIKNQPTAYDTEKVKEKLEKCFKDSKRALVVYNDEDAYGEMTPYRKSIDIVEAGGVDGR